jgi:tRNA (cmo5U34)-methyltransferase
MLAAARPDLAFTLVDLSAAMLDRAAERFAALGVPARTVVADYAREMPEGPFGAVISALSIHHLATSAKADALRLAHARLAPGAPFVNAEQVAGDTPEEDSALDAAWEVAVLAKGATPATVAAARERMAHDRCETVEANLALLRAAGFAAPACTFRAGRFAVLAARA